MTPEEERLMRLKVAQLTQQPIPPGMLSQTAGPSAAAQGAAADLTGAERGIAAQRMMANQMRGRGAPKGKKVGPSGLYVQPNWGEHLEHVTGQLGGAYMGRLANEKDVDLGERRAAKNAAQLAYQAELLRGEREYKTGEREAGQGHQLNMQGNTFGQQDKAQAALFGHQTDMQDDQQLFTGAQNDISRGLEESLANARNVLTERGQDMTSATAEAGQTGSNLRDVETVSFFNPRADEPGQSPVLTYRLVEGNVVDNNKEPVDVTGLTPYKAISPQSLDLAGSKPTAAQVEDAADAEAGLADITSRFPNMARLSQYSLEEANDFTGYNPQALLGQFGQGPEGVKAQQFNSMMSAEEVGGLLPAVKAAKLTPVSDTDVNIVREKFVNARSQPGTVAQFYAYEGRQFMDRTIKHNVSNGNISAEEGAKVQADYDKMAATLALQWGYEPKNLITAGMDEDLIKYLVEAKRRKEGK